ncbi:MAG: hypothetical protein OXL38_03990 [Gammaproteobacteria bacterium]|nr:hypothetical protein [Gammaproteobacteria bacterium]
MAESGTGVGVGLSEAGASTGAGADVNGETLGANSFMVAIL